MPPTATTISPEDCVRWVLEVLREPTSLDKTAHLAGVDPDELARWRDAFVSGGSERLAMLNGMMGPGSPTSTPEYAAPTDVSPPSSSLEPLIDFSDAQLSLHEPDSERYDVRAKLGKGGMGHVDRCYDRRMGRHVALKRLHPRLKTTATARARFVREARVQGQLEHPAVVPVYDLGSDEQGLWFTMKRIRGQTLQTLIADDELPLRRLLDIFHTVCQAIAFAHRRGVVHRDLKPENVMVGDAGEVYVLDWGVARVSGAVGDDDLDSDLHDIHILKEEGSQPYTRLGDLLGTPSYMSPEQLMGSTASERSDVYALGIILFEILTGRPLRPRGTTLAQLRDEASRPVLAPSFVAPHRDIPPELEEVCLSAMTLAPSERPTAQGLNEAIEAFLDGDRDMNLRRRRAQTHLEQAQARWQAAQDNDDEDQRTEAGRLVLQALSLDPDSQDARQLLVSVLTTPPQKLPVEAQQIIDDENLLLVKRQARGWFFFYATWLVTVPFVLFLVDVWEVWSFGLLLFALLWSLIGTGVMMWTRHVMPGLYASVAGALVACLAISRIVGPLILFPTLVLMAYSANILYPAAHHRRFVGIGCVTTFLAGMALELWGPSPCYVWLEDRLIVMPHMFGVNTDWSMMLVVSFLASACGLMGLMSARASKFIDEARAQIHRQTWQLQQLLPGEVATDRTTSNPSSERR